MYQYYEDIEHGSLALSPEELLMQEEEGDILDMFTLNETDVAATTPISVSPFANL